ncbi:MAG TPA: MFS transporter [Bryobacteraceae bacterium]
MQNHNPHSRLKRSKNTPFFHGWWVVTAAVVTFGIAVGLPYYNLPFFYDYFQSSFKWSVEEITLGFPIAALLTVWAGPLLIPRFSPRWLIVAGTGVSALAFFGFSAMKGSLWVYFGLYLLYTIGYICSGPIPHQLLVSYWFQQKRGRAMGIVYVGVGLLAGLGSFYVRALTEHLGFRAALAGVGCLMLLAWPLALLVLRDKPAEMNLFPDGASTPPSDVKLAPLGWRALFSSRAFWLLLIGSIFSIGAIGSVNIHMKFVFRDAGFSDQKLLNATWTAASVLISWTSIAGRLGIGYFADLFSKKRVMMATYFGMSGAILVLLFVTAAHHASVYVFALLFGFAMGADYMLIPLMAAEQFGINTLSRAMAIILPLNTIGQTWCPQFVSFLRQRSESYAMPLIVIFSIALAGAIAIALLPAKGTYPEKESLERTSSTSKI